MSAFIASTISFTIILIVLVNLIAQNAAVKCWDCSSNTDQNCGDPFNKSTLLVTDCNRISDTHEQQCIKIKQQVGEHWRYIRGCVMDYATQLSNATEYICEHDGCNSATPNGPHNLWLLSAAFLFIASSATIQIYEQYIYEQ